MTDTSQADNPPQHTNGISEDIDEEDRGKMRPADIDADVREMERRKRVESIMNSKLFREELERIIETQLKDGVGTSGLMQQISDMMGVSKQAAGNMFKNSNCVVPINDIRGIEAMGYGKGEKILRCKLAAVFRLIDLYGWVQENSTLITARLNQDEEHFLVNPFGMLYHEITASSLLKVDMQGNVIEQGTTNFPLNITAFALHAAIHSARPDIKCIIHIHSPSVVAVSALKCGILPLSRESAVIGDISVHSFEGGPDEKEKVARNLGPNNKVLLLTNQGAVCCGETIEEAFFNARNTVLACESQLKLIPVGIDNLILLPEESRKKMYEAARKPPESSPRPDQPSILEGKVERKWRVGGVEFEALMRMLDNAGFRTGYIYRHPLVKGEPPRPKNDVEIPPAVSSLGYLLEEEELYRQGLWKKLEGGRKGNDRTRWLNSPHVYQKVEVLETGTPDPKKITKWVSDESPTHSSTPVKIESALQFVPKNTNPKEFKRLQQQIKDYRRADKISAGPQSHILEGVTWDEARKMQDASVTQTGDQVVLMGAASKGIIQREYQHNAMMYKSPYAKNPFDSVTDEELDEYKKVVEKKAKGEYDTDFSESEGISSSAINKRMEEINVRSPVSASETEEESRGEPQVLRIETKQAPRPSQPEVVLSDGSSDSNSDRQIITPSKRSTRSPRYYRTYSHAGFPRAPPPNPTHYHVTLRQDVGLPRRLRRSQHQRQPKAMVTVNVDDVRAITVNIPLQTLREFIEPFASTLGRIWDPGCDKASQTSYLCECRDLKSDDSYLSDFEREILKNLQKDLIKEVVEESFKGDFGVFERVNEVNEVDVGNESIDKDVVSLNAREVVANVMDIREEPAVFQNVIEDVVEIFCNLPFNGVPDEVIRADVTNTSFEVKPSKMSSMVDEGFDSSANSSFFDKSLSLIMDDPDGTIASMSKVITDFVLNECYEINELIIFPENRNDEKLFEKLHKILKTPTTLTTDEKTKLRLTLNKKILDILKLPDSSDTEASSTCISDKIFSINEFISDVLDRFFDTLDTNSFAEFKNSAEHCASTPTQVTSFKKKVCEKSGTETYWFTVSESPETQVTPKRIFNVDDIPLKPPPPEEEFGNNTLSPIAEEVDVMAGGDGERTYVAYERPDVNVVVCDEVNFYRTRTVNTFSYVQASSVEFQRKEKVVEEEEEEEWMGYDAAKF